MEQKIKLSSKSARVSTTASNIILRPHIHELLQKLHRDLEEVKIATTGRPVLYYDSYRIYTIYFGIEMLESLLNESLPQEKVRIAGMLCEYKKVLE